MFRRPPAGSGRAARAVASAVVLLVVASCGSAQDLVGGSGPTSAPSPEPTASEPTPSPTPSPTTTPEPAVAPTPKSGQCRTADVYDVVIRVSDQDDPALACSQRHTAQTYAVRTMSKRLQAKVRSGNRSDVLSAARGFCEKNLTRWLKAELSTVKRSQFDFLVGVPSASDSAAGADWLRCDLFLRASTTRLAALPRKSKGALKGKKGDDYASCVQGDIQTASGTVPCSKKHRWRSVTSIKLGGKNKKFPGRGDATGVMKSECGGDVRSYLNTNGSFRYGYIVPTRATWKRGERYGVCFADTRK